MDDIEAIEHARIRPGMYIGGTDQQALHTLLNIWFEEIATQIRLGRCRVVTVTLQPDNWISIQDNGPGLSLELVERYNKTLLEVLFSCYGVRRMGDGTYISTNSYFGPIVFAINALSSEFLVEVARDGFVWEQRYSRGKAQSALTRLRSLDVSESTGTTLTFKPDPTIFQEHEFSYESLERRLFDLSMLLKSATFYLHDKRTEPHGRQVFHSENGIEDYINHLRGKTTPLHTLLYIHHEADLPDASHWYKNDPLTIELAFQYVDAMDTKVIGFVNTLPANGSHLTGFYNGLGKVLSEIAYVENLIPPRSGPLTWQKLGTGLRAIVHVEHPSLYVEAYRTPKLVNDAVESIVEACVFETISNFAQANPSLIRQVVQKCAVDRNRAV